MILWDLWYETSSTAVLLYCLPEVKGVVQLWAQVNFRHPTPSDEVPLTSPFNLCNDLAFLFPGLRCRGLHPCGVAL